MLAIGAKELEGISVTTPSGTVITILLKDITSTRATMLINAPKQYKVSRIQRQAALQENQQPRPPKQ